MKALWKYDWYRSGWQVVTAVVCILPLLLLFYGVVEFVPVDFSWQSTFSAYYGSAILPTWLFPLFTCVMVGRLIDDDRRSGWDRLCQAMPLTVRQYIREKYLLGLYGMVGSGVMVLLCHGIYTAAQGVLDIGYLMLFFLRYLMVFLVMLAVVTVLTTAKNLWAALTVSLLLPFVVYGVVTFILPGTIWLFADSCDWLFHTPLGILVGGAAAVVLYGLSYPLCVRIAENKRA